MKKNLVDLVKTTALATALAASPLLPSRANAQYTNFTDAIDSLRDCVYDGYKNGFRSRKSCERKIKREFGIRNITKEARKAGYFYLNYEPGLFGNSKESYFLAPIIKGELIDRSLTNGNEVIFLLVDSRKNGIVSNEYHKDKIGFVNKLNYRGKDGSMTYKIVIDNRTASNVARNVKRNWSKYESNNTRFLNGERYNLGMQAIYQAAGGSRNAFEKLRKEFIEGWKAHEVDHSKRNSGHSTVKAEAFAFIAGLRKTKVELRSILKEAKWKGKNKYDKIHPKAAKIVLGGLKFSGISKEEILTAEQKFQDSLDLIDKLLQRDFKKYQRTFTRNYRNTGWN